MKTIRLFPPLVMVIGLIITGLGYTLRGLITPEVAASFGIQPVSV
ncbi:hypothetical protein [Herpetosiphon gulosus]|uniref:MFS transporter n=1 Tax=Herpetosiphon gulosus TaxID=1973496 RepID=A0ABP9X5E9_9CHLR